MAHKCLCPLFYHLPPQQITRPLHHSYPTTQAFLFSPKSFERFNNGMRLRFATYWRRGRRGRISARLEGQPFEALVWVHRGGGKLWQCEYTRKASNRVIFIRLRTTVRMQIIISGPPSGESGLLGRTKS